MCCRNNHVLVYVGSMYKTFSLVLNKTDAVRMMEKVFTDKNNDFCV